MDDMNALKNFKPSKDFFVGLDSDGCVFPTMELKHKECFCPNFIRHFGFQSVSRFARETWEFVNLYSRDRGANRFPALLKSIELLIARPEFKRSATGAPDTAWLIKFIASDKPKSNAGLKEFLKENDNPDLRHLLAWSESVNRDIDAMVHDVRPFGLVRESLEKIFPKADMMVVSGTPFGALEKEWKEHGIDRFAKLTCGQEQGTKKEHLSIAAKGRYPTGHVLMVGDAPGDHKAATANSALFFPINPGNEEGSWEVFYAEALDRFFQGTYKGEFENRLVKEFYGLLPDKPGWK